jgi:hypothetical protein
LYAPFARGEMSSDRPLPAHMSRWSGLSYLRYKGGNEWHSVCPNCGDSGHEPSSGPPDRFHMHDADSRGNARGMCRRCGHFEWADQGEPWKPDPARLAQIEALRRQMAVDDMARIRSKIEWLQQAAFWREAHARVKENPELRALWRGNGIADWAIDMHRLGYVNRDEGDIGALTIPYFHGDWEQISTVQFRLLDPEAKGDRYRFVKDTRPSLFHPWPPDETSGVVLVLEGAKKGLVTQDRASGITYRGRPVKMVSQPAAELPGHLVSEFDWAELIIFALDPDTLVPREKVVHGRVTRLPPVMDNNVSLVGPDRARVVPLPAKIDDMFLAGLEAGQFQSMVGYASPWKTRGAQ